jgi:hypothetical protein
MSIQIEIYKLKRKLESKSFFPENYFNLKSTTVKMKIHFIYMSVTINGFWIDDRIYWTL